MAVSNPPAHKNLRFDWPGLQSSSRADRAGGAKPIGVGASRLEPAGQGRSTRGAGGGPPESRDNDEPQVGGPTTEHGQLDARLQPTGRLAKTTEFKK